jgi:hypothetical protein
VFVHDRRNHENFILPSPPLVTKFGIKTSILRVQKLSVYLSWEAVEHYNSQPAYICVY